MHSTQRLRHLALPVLLLALANATRAQGEFVNFEDPPIAPITIAVVGDTTHVVLCNTADNSLEIYDGDTVTPSFLQRVAVGLSPVTVRWNADNETLYTCNFQGDSVSVVRWNGSSSSFVLERTERVGDEPTDIAFLPQTDEAVVSLHSRSAVVYMDRDTLVPNAYLGEFEEEIDPLNKIGVPQHLKIPASGNVTKALKAPRRLQIGAFNGANKLFVLNTMGGNSSGYDFDVFLGNVRAAQSSASAIGGMGTTNLAMAYDAADERLFVVGGLAENSITGGIDQVRAAPLGFVRTFLWVVDLDANPTAATPEPVQDNDPPVPSPTWQSIDLNRDYLEITSATTPEEVPVPVSERVAMPTDVVLITDPNQGDAVQHVVVAFFGSDRVAVLTPDEDANGGWKRNLIDLAPSGFPDEVAGPRGLAYDPLNDRLWVLNVLNATLASFTPEEDTSPTITVVSLQSQPAPDTVLEGRRFLYSARTTSGPGVSNDGPEAMVSCSSCHVDGRTDGLDWDLSDSEATGQAIPELLVDDDPTEYLETFDIPGEFPAQKGALITQSLQGLVNSDIDRPASGTDLQYVTTNAPYHWRGDREGFKDFNGAFVDLQGMPNVGTGGAVQGLSDADMVAYRDFVESILYPPNPEQPADRVLDGDLGDPNDPLDGSDGKRGLKLFHLAEAMENRSCVSCHTLPEGSSNTFFLTTSNGGEPQPLENAAMRGLFQREKALVDGFDPSGTTWTRMAQLGLTHDGDPASGSPVERSLNDFNQAFGSLAAPWEDGDMFSSEEIKARQRAITEFSRDFDWSVGPMIGRCLTLTEDDYDSGTEEFTDPDEKTLLDAMEEAALQANSGIAVFQRLADGTLRGHWYDASQSLSRRYRRVAGNNFLSRASLLAEVEGDPDCLLVFQAVPTGSERRVAHTSGAPNPIGGSNPPTPSELELLPMVPNTFYADVTQITAFTDPDEPTGNATTRFRSIKRMRVLEAALEDELPLFCDGESAIVERHEPPRRFRVAGWDIEHGAKLILYMMRDTGECSTTPCEISLELDLAATGFRTPEGKPIWESTEELDALMTMAFRNGGPERASVRAVLECADLLDCDAVDDLRIDLVADTEDTFGVEVRNPGSTLSVGSARIDDQVLDIGDRGSLP
jgi:DNA-binding beta-propeller fold protein YncE